MVQGVGGGGGGGYTYFYGVVLPLYVKKKQHLDTSY